MYHQLTSVEKWKNTLKIISWYNHHIVVITISKIAFPCIFPLFIDSIIPLKSKMRGLLVMCLRQRVQRDRHQRPVGLMYQSNWLSGNFLFQSRYKFRHTRIIWHETQYEASLNWSHINRNGLYPTVGICLHSIHGVRQQYGSRWQQWRLQHTSYPNVVRSS